MPGPPKQFDRDEVLDRAIRTFWIYGYDGTSYERLVSDMGVSRSSLYATFGDKDSLYLEALKRYGERQMSAIAEALFHGPGSPLERLGGALRVFEKLCTEEPGAGCLMVNSMTELGLDSAVGELLVFFRRNAQLTLQRAFDEAVAYGELAADTDTQGLACFAVTFLHGVAVAAKVGVERRELRRQLDSLAAMIHRCASG